jgi:hypothetical protein
MSSGSDQPWPTRRPRAGRISTGGRQPRPVLDNRTMTNPDLDPEQYPPIDPREPVPDDAGELLPDTPDELPEAPVEPMPDDGDEAGGVREPA